MKIQTLRFAIASHFVHDVVFPEPCSPYVTPRYYILQGSRKTCSPTNIITLALPFLGTYGFLDGDNISHNSSKTACRQTTSVRVCIASTFETVLFGS